MKQKRHTTDQIISKLSQADVELCQGKNVPEIRRLLEITDQTYNRWRQKFCGMAREMTNEIQSLTKPQLNSSHQNKAHSRNAWQN